MNLRTIVLLALGGVGLGAAGLAVVRREPRPRESYQPPYVGNDRSAVFHTWSCRVFSADEAATRFRTRDEAIASGYRPCGICLS